MAQGLAGIEAGNHGSARVLCGNVRSLCVKDQCDLSAVPMSIFSVKKSINKSNNTPVSQKNTPVSQKNTPRVARFASRFARFAPVSLPFRRIFFFDWRSNKKYHPEGAALCCMVVYSTYPTL